MKLPRLRFGKYFPALLLPLGTLLFGLLLTVAVARALWLADTREWDRRAQAEAARMTQILREWIEASQAPLASLASLVEVAGAGDEARFQAALASIAAHTSSPFLLESGLMEWRDGAWRARQASSADAGSRLRQVSDAMTRSRFVRALDTARGQPNQWVMSEPVNLANGTRGVYFCLAPAAGAELVVAGVIDTETLVSQLLRTYAPDGMHLEVEAETPDRVYFDYLYSSHPVLEPQFQWETVTGITYMNLRLLWSAGPDFQGGRRSSAALTLLWSGAALSLLIGYLLLGQSLARHRITRQVESTTQALQAQAAQTRSMLESTAEGIFGVDIDGRILFANPATARLLGYAAPVELLGREIGALLRPLSHPDDGRECPLTAVLREGVSRSGDEARFRRRDGSDFAVAYVASPVVRNGVTEGAVVVFSDATEKRRAQALIEQARERAQRILDTAPVGVALTIGGVVRYANRRMAELVNLREGDQALQAYADPAQYLAIVEVLARQPTLSDVPVQMVGPQRELRDILLTTTRDEFDGERALLGWHVDVSELRHAERVQAQERRRAEEATRAKSDFLANMSHEIRTPMNTIIGMSRLALQQPASEKLRNYVDKVHRSANNLLVIIDDILDFSKIEAGKLAMEEREFELREVFENLASLVGLRAEEKGLGLAFDSAPDVPQRLVGDSLRLGQILLNLCNNAIKFTERGRIAVSVRLRGRDGTRVELQFRVRDTGIGMTREQLDKLFQPFSQADSSTTRRYGGTGLGLAICKRLVELMHGQISAESWADAGSCFEFTVWLGLQLGPRREPARPDAEVASLQGLRVLLVEDNEFNQELALELLGEAGIRVEVARDGGEALEQLARAGPFDGVLMDCQMPVMDGYEATRAIRADPRWAALPVIAMTANAMAGDREKALAAGMNDHIAKPLKVDEMFATIQRWMQPAPQPESALSSSAGD